MERVKIVVRYSDGRLIKGFTQDFFPTKEVFHLTPLDKPSGEPIEVSMKDLKAIFMVVDFVGQPLFKERKKYVEGEKPSGRKVEVTFIDGEVLVGSTLGYDPKRQGFFIFPADPKSNNIRIYVVSSFVEKVRYL
ncbi:MAG: hypothetical protein A2026_15985 [Deltaproteobacteria bacterium RBG_19FT_COMBO_46_12]|nr:MAG: hypothetical protein A2026_15985 [Deltaproteobacteria bacterium RBG_19FT_COMBO_46_12]